MERGKQLGVMALILVFSVLAFLGFQQQPFITGSAVSETCPYQHEIITAPCTVQGARDLDSFFVENYGCQKHYCSFEFGKDLYLACDIHIKYLCDDLSVLDSFQAACQNHFLQQCG